MRLRTVLSEAWRNLASGTTRAILFAILLGGVTGGLATADALTIVGIQNAAERYLASGAAVRTLTTDSEVDGETCERLAELGDISRTGALREAPPTELPALPRSPLTTYEASPAFADLLEITPETTGVWLSRALATSLGVNVGDEIATVSGTASVSAIYEYPEDGRDARLSIAMIIPVATEGTFDECWALVWPENLQYDNLLRSATVPGAGESEPINISQLNKSEGSSFDGREIFLNRVTRWSFAVAIMGGLCVGWIAVARRRVEYASSLHAGQGRGAFTATVLVETVAWTLVAAILGAEITALALILAATSIEGGLYVGLLGIVISGSAAALLGAASATLFVQEKHLFKFFKQRT